MRTFFSHCKYGQFLGPTLQFAKAMQLGKYSIVQHCSDLLTSTIVDHMPKKERVIFLYWALSGTVGDDN